MATVKEIKEHLEIVPWYDSSFKKIKTMIQ